MAGVKLVVIYPRPKDVDVFERVYQNEHVPLAVATLGPRPKWSPPRCWEEGGKETLAHAVKISTGGEPIFLVAREETFSFSQTANA